MSINTIKEQDEFQLTQQISSIENDNVSIQADNEIPSKALQSDKKLFKKNESTKNSFKKSVVFQDQQQNLNNANQDYDQEKDINNYIKTNLQSNNNKIVTAQEKKFLEQQQKLIEQQMKEQKQLVEEDSEEEKRRRKSLERKKKLEEEEKIKITQEVQKDLSQTKINVSEVMKSLKKKELYIKESQKLQSILQLQKLSLTDISQLPLQIDVSQLIISAYQDGIIKPHENIFYRDKFEELTCQQIVTDINVLLFWIVLANKFSFVVKNPNCMKQIRYQLQKNYTQLLNQIPKRMYQEYLNVMTFIMGYIIHKSFYLLFPNDRYQFNQQFILDCYHITIQELTGNSVTDYFLQSNIDKIFSYKFLNYTKNQERLAVHELPLKNQTLKKQKSKDLLNNTENNFGVKKIVLQEEIYSFLPHEKNLYKKPIPINATSQKFNKDLNDVMAGKKKILRPQSPQNKSNKLLKNIISNEKSSSLHNTPSQKKSSGGNKLQQMLLKKQQSSSMSPQKRDKKILKRLSTKKNDEHNTNSSFDSVSNLSFLQIKKRPKDFHEKEKIRKAKKINIETQSNDGIYVTENLSPSARIKAAGIDISSNRQRYNLMHVSPLVSKELNYPDNTLPDINKRIIYHPIDRVIQRRDLNQVVENLKQETNQKIYLIDQGIFDINDEKAQYLQHLQKIQQQEKEKEEKEQKQQLLKDDSNKDLDLQTKDNNQNSNIQQQNNKKNIKYTKKQDYKQMQLYNKVFGINFDQIQNQYKYKYDQYQDMLNLKIVLDKHKQVMKPLSRSQTKRYGEESNQIHLLYTEEQRSKSLENIIKKEQKQLKKKLKKLNQSSNQNLKSEQTDEQQQQTSQKNLYFQQQSQTIISDQQLQMQQNQSVRTIPVKSNKLPKINQNNTINTTYNKNQESTALSFHSGGNQSNDNSEILQTSNIIGNTSINNTLYIQQNQQIQENQQEYESSSSLTSEQSDMSQNQIYNTQQSPKGLRNMSILLEQVVNKQMNTLPQKYKYKYNNQADWKVDLKYEVDLKKKHVEQEEKSYDIKAIQNETIAFKYNNKQPTYIKKYKQFIPEIQEKEQNTIHGKTLQHKLTQQKHALVSGKGNQWRLYTNLIE